MPMKVGKYQVHKLFNPTKGYVIEYFPPTESLIQKASRNLRISFLKNEGYVPVGIIYVDEETFINLLINEAVDEYLFEDSREQELKKTYSFHYGAVDERYVDQVQIVRERKWTIQKKLNGYMKDLIHKDYQCYNEVAIQLNDQWLRNLHD